MPPEVGEVVIDSSWVVCVRLGSNNNFILRLAIATPLRQPFDYLPFDGLSSDQLQPGIRIRVPFGRREVVGVLLEVVAESAVPLSKLKPIIEVLDQQPLIPKSLLKLCHFASDYYHCPVGEVMVASLPKLLRQGRSATIDEQLFKAQFDTTPTTIALNQPQQVAVETILRVRGFETFLLSGVTGSGKTEVYLRCIEPILKANQQALVLVPEIALTPQTIDRFRDRFDVPIELMHSNITDKVRMQAWLSARNGEAAIIIGTRSAIFTPLLNLGIIILDEEHDPSLKQQSGFRYSARDVAVMRGHIENIPVILGSATPSLESLYNAQRKRYHLLTLPKRAGEAQRPAINVVDLRRKTLVEGMSDTLLSTMEAHLKRGGQVLVFLNRRGFAPALMCHGCGFVVLCGRCDARMTLHQYPTRLYCHHCGASHVPPRICPQCQQAELMHVGVGTERLEAALEKRFAEYSLVRVDRDSTRTKDSMKHKLQQIHEGEANILIGTQMLAKGHHFANLTLVAVVDADSGLFSADFRAIERMAQLLVQVSGRAGREEKRGEVLIQTHHPDNPLLNLLLNHDYTEFAQTLLSERKLAQLPPFSHMALLRAEAVKSDLPLEFLHAAKKALCQQPCDQIEILGPIPAPMERRAGRYRCQLLLQSNQRPALQTLLKSLTHIITKLPSSRKIRWSLDVDPQEMV